MGWNPIKDVKKLWGKVEDDPLKALGVAILAPVALAGAAGLAGTAIAAAPIVAPAMSAREQYKAGEQAKDIGRANAAAIAAETEERVRVVQEENRRRESAARARAAASGLSGASSEIYINALMETGRQDIDWLRKAGESRESAALSEGQTAYHQARAAMWGSIGGMSSGGIGTITSLFG